MEGAWRRRTEDLTHEHMISGNGHGICARTNKSSYTSSRTLKIPGANAQRRLSPPRSCAHCGAAQTTVRQVPLSRAPDRSPERIRYGAQAIGSTAVSSSASSSTAIEVCAATRLTCACAAAASASTSGLALVAHFGKHAEVHPR